MNTREIAAALPDVPIATLYRQVRILFHHHVIEAVAHRRVNGIVEPTYAVRREAARFKAHAFAEIPSRDDARYVGVLAGTQIVVAERYFSSRNHDVVRDGATYMAADLPLTDAEARSGHGFGRCSRNSSDRPARNGACATLPCRSFQIRNWRRGKNDDTCAGDHPCRLDASGRVRAAASSAGRSTWRTT